jgi:Flp pilus assembly pilin Flp
MWKTAHQTALRVFGRAWEHEGQTLAEYVVLTGFIAIVVVAAAMLVGNTILGLFNQVLGIL